MVTIQIRSVPDEVRDALVAQAAERGEPLQDMLLALLTRESRVGATTAALGRFEGRRDGSRLTAAEVAEAIARARDARDARGTTIERTRPAVGREDAEGSASSDRRGARTPWMRRRPRTP